MSKFLKVIVLCCVAGLATSCFCYHGDGCNGCSDRGYGLTAYNDNALDYTQEHYQWNIETGIEE